MPVEAGFQDQFVLIAGGFRGMGLELAKLVLADGAHVGVIGRNPERGVAAEDVLNADGPKYRARSFRGDLSIPETLERIRNEVSQWCNGNLHHLAVFLGSGKTPFGYDFPVEHWRNVFETNFFGPLGAVQAFIPMMTHKKGCPSIALTGAIAGMERVRAPMTYSVAKTALIGYANHLAASLVEKGIRVFAISPGNVFYKGGRWEEILAERGKEIEEFLEHSVGMKRLGTAEELAWVYFSTMSPRNAFMTGHNLVVDGLQINRIL